MADTTKNIDVNVNFKINRKGFADSVGSKEGFSSSINEKSTIDKAAEIAKISKIATPGLMMDAILSVPMVLSSLTKVLIWIVPAVLTALLAESVFGKFFKKDDTTADQMTDSLISGMPIEEQSSMESDTEDMFENPFEDMMGEGTYSENGQGFSSAFAAPAQKTQSRDA